jgi:mycothiol synthase
VVDVEIRAPISPTDVATMRRLAEDVRRNDHRVVLDDSHWDELRAPPSRSAIILALETGAPSGAAYIAPAEGAGDGRFNAELVVGDEDVAVAPLLLDGATQHVRAVGGTHLQLWVFGAETRDDVMARTAGLAPTRDLWQMRVPLPRPDEPAWPPGIEVRSFVPGEDEDTWLEANNRAFAADPDQGGWTRDELDRREREAWFDPSGFLLAFDTAVLAGFCWTKIHPAHPPVEPNALGEIYVVGVDPGHQGRGLGRALIVAGLGSLHRRGPSVGMLYVDAANTAAVALYRQLGFDVARVDRAYIRSVA